MARTRFDDSLIYWRVLPIGLATAFASGVILSLSGIVYGTQIDAGWAQFGRSVALFGGVAVIIGVVLWLPISLIWHIIAIRLRDRLGMYRAAFAATGIFCMVLVIFPSLVFVVASWPEVSWYSIPFFLFWSIGTCIVAMAMTYWGFRPAQAKGKNT
jgi:hypothetical protein